MMDIFRTSTKIAVVKVKIEGKTVDATLSQKTVFGRAVSFIKNTIFNRNSGWDSGDSKLSWKEGNQTKTMNLKLALKLDPNHFKHIDTSKLDGQTQTVLHGAVETTAKINDGMHKQLTSLVQNTVNGKVSNDLPGVTLRDTKIGTGLSRSPSGVSLSPSEISLSPSEAEGYETELDSLLAEETNTGTGLSRSPSGVSLSTSEDEGYETDLDSSLLAEETNTGTRLPQSPSEAEEYEVELGSPLVKDAKTKVVPGSSGSADAG